MPSKTARRNPTHKDYDLLFFLANALITEPNIFPEFTKNVHFQVVG